MSSSSCNKRDGVVVTTGDSSASKSCPQKRAKCVQQKPQQDPFGLLTDDAALVPIFEFIGPYQFRFIAGVSKRFRCLYTQFQKKEYRKRVPDEEKFNKLISTTLTSAASIAESLSRAKVFLDDTRKLAIPFKSIWVKKHGSQDWDSSFIPPKPAVFFLRDFVAVQYGRLEILQLAVANGCTCNEYTCERAARKGHLDILQWLRTNGCPWNELTSAAAAGGGHFEVLQWARENGCPSL